MNDLMIDIETLGTNPRSVVLSIGAVMFGPGGLGAEFYHEICLNDSLANGALLDADTLKWWFEQDIKPPISGEHFEFFVLTQLSNFFGDHEPERVWAKGPQFDIVMVEELYRRHGRVIPWTYRQPRDVRTALDMLRPVDQKMLDELWKGKVEHNALDDAKLQAQHLIIARLFDYLD